MIHVLDAFLETMLSDESEEYSRFLNRELQDPTEAFERMYQQALKPWLLLFISLLETISPDTPRDEHKAHAIFLIGKNLIARAGRSFFSRAFNAPDLSPEIMALLRKAGHDQIAALFGAAEARVPVD